MTSDDELTAAIKTSAVEVRGLLDSILAVAAESTVIDRVNALNALSRCVTTLRHKRVKRRMLAPVKNTAGAKH